MTDDAAPPVIDRHLPDHRRLGRELEMFATDELVGAGLPLWLPAGTTVRQELERFILDEERRAGWQHVVTPALGRRELYELSGHWAHYRDDMFPPMPDGSSELVLRPMNCPHHALVYRAAARSYRDLPLRIAELGTMYRNERSGVVGGLSRVRSMALNDGHVFCSRDELSAELASIVAMMRRAWRVLGIDVASHRLSLRGPGEKYIDDDDLWRQAEGALRAALDELEVSYVEAPGEAAFYGPKLDVQVRDPRGREETLSTVQVDFLLGRRLNLTYTDADASRQVPVVLHRSVISTMERMVACLLETHDGALPPWLSPVQVQILPVSSDDEDAAGELFRALTDDGRRAQKTSAQQTLGQRIREGERRRVPWSAIIGPRERRVGHVTVRLRGGEQLPDMSFDAFRHEVARAVAGRDVKPASRS